MVYFALFALYFEECKEAKYMDSKENLDVKILYTKTQ